MRVIRTVNDTIRLLFNPKTDSLKLGDFLLTRDGEHNFLGQIIEIYDDKYNLEENVAKIKLIFRVGKNNEILPYDNFTPSRECEIAKIKQEEIEKVINAHRETLKVGLGAKNKKPFECPVGFFDNNPVIFADKLDESNCAFENLAPKLSKLKKVIVFDFAGTLNVPFSKKIKAIDDFKLPLDYYSLDYIWEKGLAQAKLETQAVLEDIFNELKAFIKDSEEKYIPFPRFIKVIESQYKQTPVVELKVLANRMRRYHLEGLFARSKKEFECLGKSIAKNDITVIDLSSLKIEWMKDFLEYIIRQISNDTYVLLRLNENNSNADIINLLYGTENIKPVVSISYGYKNMPRIMEFANNYILYQTFNPRRDFGFANFWAESVNPESYIMFGQDTKNFMFSVKNAVFDESQPEEHKEKLYIELDLELEEMTPVELAGSNFEFKDVHIKPRLKDEVEIDEVLNEPNEENLIEAPEVYEAAQTLPQDEIQEDAVPLGENELDFYENQNEPQEAAVEQEEIAEDYVLQNNDEQHYVDTEPLNEDFVSEDADSQSEDENNLNNEIDAVFEDEVQPQNVYDEEIDDEPVTPSMIEAAVQNEEIKEIFEEPLETEPEKEYPADVANEAVIPDINFEAEFQDVNEVIAQTEYETQISEEAVEANVEENLETSGIEEPADFAAESPDAVENEVYEESDLDYISAEETEINQENALKEVDVNSRNEIENIPANLVVSQQEAIIQVEEKPILQIEDYTEGDNTEEIQSTNKEDSENASKNLTEAENINSGINVTDASKEDNVSLVDIAKKSIETRFDEVIKENVSKSSKNQLKINENVSIDLEKIKNNIDSDNETVLPIFKTEDAEDDVDYTFSEGEAVLHERYGEGKILKVVKYSNRCLLQIEFKEVGKRLLDPKIAHVKPVQ